MSGGTLTGKRWQPGDVLEIPENIILHHANWTREMKKKIVQLEVVRNLVACSENVDTKQVQEIKNQWEEDEFFEKYTAQQEILSFAGN